MVRNHPSIGQKNVGTELNGNHFGIYLNHDTLQPTTYALASFFVVTIDFYNIPNLVGPTGFRRFHV
jgi:hypothetical protein